LRITAQGLDTFDRKSGKNFLDHVGTLIERYEIVEIVVGHPLHLSGGASESSEKAKSLAADLQSRFEVTVTMWDERLSSAEAKRVLKGQRAGKAAVDKLAAVIILQGYLDFRSNQA